MRAYELLVILDGDLEEGGIEPIVEMVEKSVANLDGNLKTTDRWGKRKFAYEINHKSEGYYVLFEMTIEKGDFSSIERQLRLADEVVRHKMLRLPDSEAAKRGLFGETVAAS